MSKIIINGQEVALGGSDLPREGEPGQVLTKTEDGVEWKDNETYSLEEKRIGTWIDGEPLYRTVVKMNVTVNNTTMTGITINNKQELVRLTGICNRGDGICVQIPAPIDNGNLSVYLRKSGQVVLSIGINSSDWGIYQGSVCYIILEYTKISGSTTIVTTDKRDIEPASASDAPEQI